MNDHVMTSGGCLNPLSDSIQSDLRNSDPPLSSLPRGFNVIAYLWVYNKVRYDLVLLQVGVSVLPIPLLYFVGPVQMLKRDWRDVDTSANQIDQNTHSGSYLS